MNTEMNNAVSAAELTAQYDASAKRLLGALLSMELAENEKLSIMEDEYGIPVRDDLRKDVDSMCNLGQGVLEMGYAKGQAAGYADGKARGHAEGRAEGELQKARETAYRLLRRGSRIQDIADILDVSVQQVEEWLTETPATI